MNKFKGTAAMLAASIIWGLAFSAQSSGMKFVAPMLFVMLRSIAGVLALGCVIMLLDYFKYRKLSVFGAAVDRQSRKNLIVGGVLCGMMIAAASTLQQFGLQSTTAGKSGFLTALYIIIVPVMGIFFKRKTNFMLYLAVILALCGTYILCGSIGQIKAGDIFLIGCAFAFALHIMVIDFYAPKCDCVRLSCVQFTAAAIFAAIGSLLCREAWIFEKIAASLPFWIFCGIGSSAIAFTLQMYAQKYLHPVTASLLMSLESVFAVLGGRLFLRENISCRELLGCAVIMVAVILAQIPSKKQL